MATDSRRNWLYFAGYQFRKNWSRRLLFSCFAGHFVRDKCVVCCKHTSNSDARSALHMSSATKKPANEQSTTSGVKSFLLACKRFFLLFFFFAMFFFGGVLLFSSRTSDPSMSDRKYVCRCSALQQCRSHSTCFTPGRHGLTYRRGTLYTCTSYMPKTSMSTKTLQSFTKTKSKPELVTKSRHEKAAPLAY